MSITTFDHNRFFIYIKQLLICLCYIMFSANTGGILGLFMGFSIFSLIEIIYYISVRPYCANKSLNLSIFKATSKSPRDSQVIDLVSVSTRRVLSGQFFTRTVLECCSANNKMMGAAEIHKTAAVIICDPYTMPAHNIFLA